MFHAVVAQVRPQPGRRQVQTQPQPSRIDTLSQRSDSLDIRLRSLADQFDYLSINYIELATKHKELTTRFDSLTSKTDTVIASPAKFGLTLQVNSLNYDDIKVGWFNTYNSSLDDHTMRHNSYSIGAMAQYNLSTLTTIRLRVAVTQLKMNEYYDFIDEMEILSDVSVTGNQTRFAIAPGMVWKVNQNKMQFYGGFELPVNLHGEFKLMETRLQYDTGGSNLTHSTLATTIPKGFSAGMGAIGGFQYFIKRNITIGAEFSSALLYAKLSGETAATLTTIEPVSREPVIVNTQDGNSGITFNDNRLSIGFSYWFGSKFVNTTVPNIYLKMDKYK